ncbi:putative peptide zinc metalloprotease protein [Sphingomonas kyeonggiensis]|uniref:hypothetical protein n=1 Tax=Sphingomonas kyeonggiensis TaxID=1268553 RepID=UPI00278A34A5|nr:hypothetical protein [Sphingomonas kyeonggiensis]MDQ0248330.1 putative peptide zinc metalloprotease protein [Sphingomonas kyeonggiensis]
MTAAYPALDRQVTIDPPHESFAIVRNGATNRYFRLGEREAAFAASLDGATSLEALADEQRFGFSGEQVRRMVAFLHEHRLLAQDETLAEPAPRISLPRRIFDGLMHHDRVRFTLFHPDAFLERHVAVVHALFSRPAVGLYLLCFLSPVIVTALRPDLAVRAAGAYQPLLPLWQWFTLYLTMLAINFGHEMSHAAACKHFGGRVGRIGLMLMYLTPVPFCDVSDAWRFRETGPKVVVSAAGILFQLLVSAVFVDIWLFTGSSLVAYLALLNTGIAVMNLFPLIKLDGYWILSHLTRQPNLKTLGLKAVDQRFRRLIGRAKPGTPARPALFAFGVAHLIVLPLFWGLGLVTLYRLTSRLSLTFAWLLCGLLAAMLLYRFARSALRYSTELRT